MLIPFGPPSAMRRVDEEFGWGSLEALSRVARAEGLSRGTRGASATGYL